MDKSKKNIALWVIQALLAAFFALQGAMKLGGGEEVVANFQRWGFPDKFYLLIGGLEILGGIGLLIPRTTIYAAAGLVIIMIGAAITHITHGEAAMLPMPIIPLLLLAAVAYLRRPSKQSAMSDAHQQG
ncbi:MAG: DoxX family protein [Acidobacteriota bacterium]